MAEQLKSIAALDPKIIIKGKRLRPASRAGIDAVKSSIVELGVMKDSIHIRKKKNGEFHLMAGLHRLEAVLELEWDAIPVVAWTCTDDWALMMEIDDNLAGADLTALDTAVFLAERKRVYEKMHPETKAGVAGGLARQNSASDIVSFAEATAEKFGLSRRHVQRLIAVGSALDHDQLCWLRAAKKPVTLADLQALSKIGDDHVRSQVCIKLTNGEAKGAADAIRSISAKPAPVKEPVEEAFKALKNAWDRAPKAARKRFLSHEAAEIYAFLVAEGMLK